MKRTFLLLAMLAVGIAMQAQTQYHDVAINEAKGAVKSITQSAMGQVNTVTFTPEGKMENKMMTDLVYDENGFLQSAMAEMQGTKIKISFIWEQDRVKGQTMNVMGNDVTTSFNYDENGVITSQSVDMGVQSMQTDITDYKFDDHGNWISRKLSIMGQTVEQTRTIEYYE